MEAYVWASTDPDLGVCISTRVFGSAGEAVDDAQDCIGDACPVTWHAADGAPVFAKQAGLDAIASRDGLLGDFTDSDGNEGHVTISAVKVHL